MRAEEVHLARKNCIFILKSVKFFRQNMQRAGPACKDLSINNVNLTVNNYLDNDKLVTVTVTDPTELYCIKGGEANGCRKQNLIVLDYLVHFSKCHPHGWNFANGRLFEILPIFKIPSFLLIHGISNISTQIPKKQLFAKFEPNGWNFEKGGDYKKTAVHKIPANANKIVSCPPFPPPHSNLYNNVRFEISRKSKKL
jgi:hypothetical protein